MSRSPIQACAEWKRINALPRRTVEITEEVIDRVTATLLRPGAVGRLRPVQVLALLEVLACGGLLGPIRVGAGKTLITFLAPTLLGAERPVLLVPAKLREKTVREYVEASRTWLVHPRLQVDSYEMQSRVDHAERMLAHAPDVLILDEAHRTKSADAAVTRRVTRYVTERRPKVIAVSGTLIRADVRDVAHLADWALGEGSPVPRTWTALETWGALLDQRRDPGERPGREAGVLARWCASPDPTIAEIREAFRDRVNATPGVISTTDAGPDVPLVLERWAPPVPPDVADALAELARTESLPDGRDIEDPLALTRARNELALGFWYRWKIQPPKRWLHTRRLWAWFVRQTCRSTELDSVEHVAQACAAGTVAVPTIGQILADREENPHAWDVDHTAPIYEAWKIVRPTFEPQTEPVWITTEIAEAAAQWARDNRGIVWCAHATFGHRLDSLGVTYYGAGGLDRAGRMIEAGSGPIAASVKANAEGRNLQRQWSRNLVTALSRGRASAAECEQLIARTHRDGTPAELVTVAIMLAHEHQIEALESTLNGARFLEQTTGQPQKLTIAVNATGIA